MVTPEEIAQAMAVHSIDDSVSSHRGADNLIMTGDGQVQPAPTPDRDNGPEDEDDNDSDTESNPEADQTKPVQQPAD